MTTKQFENQLLGLRLLGNKLLGNQQLGGGEKNAAVTSQSIVSEVEENYQKIKSIKIFFNSGYKTTLKLL